MGRGLTRRAAVAAIAAACAAACATPASAEELLSTTVTAADASARSCIAKPFGGAAVADRAITAPGAGWVTARLNARSGDWDLGVFDAVTGRRVTGSAFFGADEVAKGIVTAGQRVVVQACRRSGTSERADLDVSFDAIDPKAKATKSSLVRVSTPNASTQAGADRARPRPDRARREGLRRGRPP